jgi:hypothetical protein
MTDAAAPARYGNHFACEIVKFGNRTQMMFTSRSMSKSEISLHGQALGPRVQTALPTFVG